MHEESFKIIKYISFFAANFLICFHYTNKYNNIIYCAKWMVVGVIELNLFTRCKFFFAHEALKLPSFYKIFKNNNNFNKKKTHKGGFFVINK